MTRDAGRRTMTRRLVHLREPNSEPVYGPDSAKSTRALSVEAR